MSKWALEVSHPLQHNDDDIIIYSPDIRMALRGVIIRRGYHPVYTPGTHNIENDTQVLPTSVY